MKKGYDLPQQGGGTSTKLLTSWCIWWRRRGYWKHRKKALIEKNMHLDLFVSRRHLQSFTFTVSWNCTRDSPKIVQQAGHHLLWRPVQLIVCTFVPLKDRHASAPAASLYPCLWTRSQQWKPEMRKASFQDVLSLQHLMCRKWRNISESTWFTFKFLQFYGAKIIHCPISFPASGVNSGQAETSFLHPYFWCWAKKVRMKMNFNS